MNIKVFCIEIHGFEQWFAEVNGRRVAQAWGRAGAVSALKLWIYKNMTVVS